MNFNRQFLTENNIIFGGGTRIALEINEYRESIDIDFLCPNKKSFKSVREQVSSSSLGELVKEDFRYAREIRFDRDAVRTVIDHEDTIIKLEFVSFDDYDLKWISNKELFPVPFLDHNSCFYTKLLANSDRKLVYPYKDIIDLLAMRSEWGGIPQESIDNAINHYGRKTVIGSLIQALKHIQENTEVYLSCADDLSISSEYASALINEYVPILLDENKL